MAILSPGSVREAEIRDCGAIARIYVDSWRDTYAGILPTSMLVNMSHTRLMRHWQWRIAGVHQSKRPCVAVMVIENENGAVVGFGESGPSRDVDPGYDAEIYTLYLDPDHLGAGMGRQLLQGLFVTLSNGGINSAIIWALADNPYRHFYSSIGGILVAERMSSYWGQRLREMGYGWSDLNKWLIQEDQAIGHSKQAH